MSVKRYFSVCFPLLWLAFTRENLCVIPREDFRSLVHRAQGGEREAIERLLALVRPGIEEVVRSFADPARPDESTSDLVQEAWLRAWRGIEGFRGGATDEETMAMFRGWVKQIAQRTGLNAQRDRDTTRRGPPGGAVLPLDRLSPDSSFNPGVPAPAAPGLSPSSLARHDEETRRIHEALASISDPTVRDVVRLRFFEELPLTQVARQLGLSYDEARGRFESGMRILERLLGEYE